MITGESRSAQRGRAEPVAAQSDARPLRDPDFNFNPEAASTAVASVHAGTSPVAVIAEVVLKCASDVAFGGLDDV